MSKKHYIKLAAMFNEHLAVWSNRMKSVEPKEKLQCQAAQMAIAEVVRDFCNIAAGDNPNFDRGRFLAACGL